MKMKKIATAALTAVMLISACLLPASALEYGEEWTGASQIHTTKYSDVPTSHWAYANIMRTSDKQWFSGYPDGTFRPNAQITRSEAVTVFAQFLGMEVTSVSSSSFYDVDVNKWYAPYVEACKDLLPVHVVPGGQTPFRPEQVITREDTMYALVKALGYDSEVNLVNESVLNMFNDQNSISRNIRPYVAWAVQNGLVSGKVDGKGGTTIGAQDPLTRAEFATLLYRGSFFGFNDKQEAQLQSVSVTPTGRVELNVGESFTITAKASYSDGSQKDYPNANPYNADDNGVVSINNGRVTAMKAGSCEIKFQGEDLKDKSIVVIVTRGTGELSLTLNDAGASTSATYVIISGTVRDSAGGEITLTCNGRAVAVDEDGLFDVVVPLEVGENTIDVTATNDTGSSVSKSIIVSRFEAA